MIAAQQQITPIQIGGVRLFLVADDAPEEMKKISAKQDGQLQNCIDVIRAKQTAEELQQALSSVALVYLRLLLGNMDGFVKLVRFHPGSILIGIQASLQKISEKIDLLPTSRLHRTQKNDINWCLFSHSKMVTSFLSDAGFVRALSETHQPEDFQRLGHALDKLEEGASADGDEAEELRALLEYSEGSLCLSAALQDLDEVEPHPLLENWCEKAYWSMRRYQHNLFSLGAPGAASQPMRKALPETKKHFLSSAVLGFQDNLTKDAHNEFLSAVTKEN